MSPKTFLLASFVVTSFVLAASAGCGGDDEGSGAAGFSCPKVGEKNCPNDTGATEATVNSCKQCEAENKKYSECLGGRPKCGADGKSESIDLTKCTTELQALIKCVQGGSSSSGGTDAGGG